VIFDGAPGKPGRITVNDDGTTSFVTIDPAITGLEFGRSAAGSALVYDAQHEYVHGSRDRIR
jgi:hypothetical protein